MIADYLGKWDLWPFTYIYRVALDGPGGANPTILQFGLPIQGDADFVWREHMIDIMNPQPANLRDFIGVNPSSAFCQDPTTGGPPTGAFSFAKRIRMPNDLAIHNDMLWSGAANINSLVVGNVQNDGNACRPQPIIPDALLLRSTSLRIDLQNLTNLTVFAPPNSSLALEIALKGWKLIPKGSVFHVDRTKRYLALPAVYQAPLPPTAAGTYTPNNIVTLESATQFLLYAVDCDARNTGFQMTVYGARGERTSSLNITGNPFGLVSRGNLCGTSREPGCFTPPIEYPAGGNIVFDFYAPVGYTPQDPNAQLCFRGVKLYPIS